jgi:hypothetical protein
MREFSVNSGEMHWEEAQSYSPGARICILRRGDNGRIRTMLLRVGSNFSAGGHTNTTGEEQLVLGGEIQSAGKSYGRGSYRFIPAGSSHDPWLSATGALLLVRWD